MTYTEQYNQYVLEYIKENPAFSSYYEPMLDFDEWIYNYMIEFSDWKDIYCIYYDCWNIRVPLGDKYSDVYTIEELLEIFKKERGL
jgi:hypothetical protein